MENSSACDITRQILKVSDLPGSLRKASAAEVFALLLENESRYRLSICCVALNNQVKCHIPLICNLEKLICSR